MRRTRGGEDGRTVQVELTDTGHTRVEDHVEDLLQHEEALLSSLSPDQREQLTGLLRILRSDLTTRFGADDRP